MRAKTQPPHPRRSQRTIALEELERTVRRMNPEHPEAAFAAFEEYLLEVCVEDLAN